MIEWHKAKDELPPIGKTVIVAMSNYFDQYVEGLVCIMKYDGDGHWKYYESEIECVGVLQTDCWAYINLPEKDGDLD